MPIGYLITVPLQRHQREIGDASRDFQLGLAIWEREQKRKQALLVISMWCSLRFLSPFLNGDFLEIAFSIAILATGDPAPIGDIVETVEEAAKNISEIAKISESVKQLQDVVLTLNTMWSSTLKTVETMMQIKNNPDWDVSTSAGDMWVDVYV